MIPAVRELMLSPFDRYLTVPVFLALVDFAATVHVTLLREAQNELAIRGR
jgi:hypothetical protein